MACTRIPEGAFMHIRKRKDVCAEANQTGTMHYTITRKHQQHTSFILHALNCTEQVEDLHSPQSHPYHSLL